MATTTQDPDKILREWKRRCFQSTEMNRTSAFSCLLLVSVLVMIIDNALPQDMTLGSFIALLLCLAGSLILYLIAGAYERVLKKLDRLEKEGGFTCVEEEEE